MDGNNPEADLRERSFGSRKSVPVAGGRMNKPVWGRRKDLPEAHLVEAFNLVLRLNRLSLIFAPVV